jgi:hypothetical protein
VVLIRCSSSLYSLTFGGRSYHCGSIKVNYCLLSKTITINQPRCFIIDSTLQITCLRC